MLRTLRSLTLCLALLLPSLAIFDYRLCAQVTQDWVARDSGTLHGQFSPSAIASDTFGNIYITGSLALTNGSTTIAVIKYDSLGNELWASSFNGSFGFYGF